MDLHALRLQICDVCHKMWQQGWVAANDGNVSVKLDDGTFLLHWVLATALVPQQEQLPSFLIISS